LARLPRPFKRNVRIDPQSKQSCNLKAAAVAPASSETGERPGRRGADDYWGDPPSVSLYNLLAATLGKVCTSPLGHFTVSETEVAPARPKWMRFES
jgi:hypothetical protein